MMKATRCLCRETTVVRVKISADLSCDGREKWKDCRIDECIAPIVQALQEAGIDMRGCCCGHGEDGNIHLQDGRILIIKQNHLANPGVGGSFGSVIAVARRAHGWNQAALSDGVGISRNYVSAIERDRANNLSISILVKLADVLGLDRVMLFKLYVLVVTNADDR